MTNSKLRIFIVVCVAAASVAGCETFYMGSDAAREAREAREAQEAEERRALLEELEERYQEEMSALLECTDRAIPRLDDRTSQADLVAEAVMRECREDVQRVVSTRLEAEDPDWRVRSDLERAVRSGLEGAVINAVLRSRVEHDAVRSGD